MSLPLLMVLLPQSSPFYLLVRSRLPFLMSVCQVIKSPRRFKPLSVSFPLELPKPTQSKRSKTRVLNVNQTSLTCEGGGGKAPPLSHPTDTPPTPHPPAHPDPLHSGCNLTGTYIMMEIWEQYSCIANEEQQLGHLFFYPLIIIMKYTKTCCGFFLNNILMWSVNVFDYRDHVISGCWKSEFLFDFTAAG